MMGPQRGSIVPGRGRARAMTYIDDNFGHYTIDDQDDIEFYHKVQATSIWKRCLGCGCLKKLLPQYAYCDNCSTQIESGIGLDPPDMPDAEVDMELQIRRAAQKVEDEIHRRQEIAHYKAEGDERYDDDL